MPDATIDVAALYAALDKKRDSQGLSWRDLSGEVRVSASTFSRMLQGGRPDIDTFAALLRWLGMSAEDFTRPSGTQAKSSEPLAMISSHLRARKDVRKEDIEAFEDIMMAAYRRLIEKKKT